MAVGFGFQVLPGQQLGEQLLDKAIGNKCDVAPLQVVARSDLERTRSQHAFISGLGSIKLWETKGAKWWLVHVVVVVDTEVLVAGTKAMPGIGSSWTPKDVQSCPILGF